jgi:GntR family histidine utilization transcriptional repressor
VQAEALRRIRTREWPPGALIPHEEALARELGCARTTVNRALRDLAEAGLLERRRKAGTRVAEHPIRKATFEIPIIRLDVEGRGLRYGYRLLDQATGPAPGAVTGALPLPKGSPMLHLTALHSANDAPFCLEDRWINPEVPGLGQADFATLSANEWLVQNVAFSRGDIAFGAVAADDTLAKALNCPPGTALLTVTRQTWSGAQPITHVTLVYGPGHRMTTTI